MTITAKMVQELRERTGAPLMDCKRALESSKGDLEAAIDSLRKAGLKSAEKRAGRSTAEGRVRAWVSKDGQLGSIVALTSETDFVAKTEEFGKLADALAAHVASRAPQSVDELLHQELDGGGPIAETIKSMSGKMGENMQVASLARLENKKGRVGAYVHHDHKQGALVSVTSSRPAAEIDAFLRTLAMHVVARKPIALRREDIPAAVVERERSVYLESEDVLAKPADKREFIVKGKLEKYFASSALLEQPWVLDDTVPVQKALAAALGGDARIEGFALCLASA
jgi:elongation factor Ts